MKQWIIITALICATSFLQGDETEKHVPPGTRQMSMVEKTHLQEQRALHAVRQDDEEQASLSQEETPATIEEMQAMSKQEDSQEKKSNGYNTLDYSTSHSGAYHYALFVSPLGDTVELADGSIWSVRTGDRYKTLDWLKSDVILIVPNRSWFSVYDYCLINYNTGASVEVNMSLGPILNGIKTYRIVAIDYENRQLCLQDGSVWNISFWDRSVFDRWLVNDTIIIGTNNGWFNGSRPNILLNVNMLNYAAAKCTF